LFIHLLYNNFFEVCFPPFLLSLALAQCHAKSLLSVFFPDNRNLFLTACSDGQLTLFDLRDPLDGSSVMAASTSPFHSVAFNPVEPRLFIGGQSFSQQRVILPKSVMSKFKWETAASKNFFNFLDAW
jgi:WD40 repeat protein